MKERSLEKRPENEDLVIGIFGEARLVKSAEGLHLEGGSMADRVEAQEWAAVHLRKRLLVRRPSCRPAR